MNKKNKNNMKCDINSKYIIANVCVFELMG